MSPCMPDWWVPACSDAACPGQVFTSPTPDQMLAAAQAVNTGAGVLFIVKNYEGDVMNFAMAAEMLGEDCATVITDDDVAVEKSTYSTGRRGVAGTLIVEKIVGAAAERGSNLEQLKTLGERVNAATRSMGVALTSCTVPAVGRPTFDIGDSDMEMGVGIHGEPGRRRVPLTKADAIAEEMLGAIVGDLSPRSGQPVLLFVNGFGGTPAMELYLMYDAARRELDKRKLADRAQPGRQLRHIAGDGGLFDYRLRVGRGNAGAVGRASPYRSTHLGVTPPRPTAVRLAGRASKDAALLPSSIAFAASPGVGDDRPGHIRADLLGAEGPVVHPHLIDLALEPVTPHRAAPDVQRAGLGDLSARLRTDRDQRAIDVQPLHASIVRRSQVRPPAGHEFHLLLYHPAFARCRVGGGNRQGERAVAIHILPCDHVAPFGLRRRWIDPGLKRDLAGGVES